MLPSGPGWARFRVEFPGEAREIEWVTVWASDRSDAVSKAREWIQRTWTADPRDGWEGPFGGVPVVRRIGDGHDGRDVGVSADPDQVNYGCVSKRGVALSVRVDADRLIDDTTSFRGDPIWAPVRRAALDTGLDPDRVVVVDLWLADQEPAGCWVITTEPAAWAWPVRWLSQDSSEVDTSSFRRIEQFHLDKSRGLRGGLRAAQELRDAGLL